MSAREIKLQRPARVSSSCIRMPGAGSAEKGIEQSQQRWRSRTRLVQDEPSHAMAGFILNRIFLTTSPQVPVAKQLIALFVCSRPCKIQPLFFICLWQLLNLGLSNAFFLSNRVCTLIPNSCRDLSKASSCVFLTGIESPGLAPANMQATMSSTLLRTF